MEQWNGELVNVKVKKLHSSAVIPQYQSQGAAGFDLHCLDFRVSILPDNTEVVETGLAMEIPPGYELQIRPRSGLAIMYGCYIANSPATIDSDYRGPIKILITNNTKSVIEFTCGERIAQGVLKRVSRAMFFEAQELEETERGDGGLGSTGRR